MDIAIFIMLYFYIGMWTAKVNKERENSKILGTLLVSILWPITIWFVLYLTPTEN